MTTISDWIDALVGLNPRLQPWQREMIERLWARRLERSRPKPKPLEHVTLASTNWGSGDRWFYELWMMARAGQSFPMTIVEMTPERRETFVVGMDVASGADVSAMVVFKKRSVGCSRNPPARQFGWSGILFFDEAPIVLESGSTTVPKDVLKHFDKCVAEDCEKDRKARVPFYERFLPKRRLK